MPTKKELENEVQRIKEGQKGRNDRYNANTVDRISFTVPKGMKEEIAAYAERKGMSVNAFVSSVILDMIKTE